MVLYNCIYTQLSVFRNWDICWVKFTSVRQSFIMLKFETYITYLLLMHLWNWPQLNISFSISLSVATISNICVSHGLRNANFLNILFNLQYVQLWQFIPFFFEIFLSTSSTFNLNKHCLHGFSEDRKKKVTCSNGRFDQLTSNCTNVSQLQKPGKRKFGDLMSSYGNEGFINTNFIKKTRVLRTKILKIKLCVQTSRTTT